MKYNVIGICAGGGTLLFPFKKKLLFNLEPRSCFHMKDEEQWRLNFGDIPFIKSWEFPEVKKDRDLILIGSPNCGSSSMFRFSRAKTLKNPKEDKTIELFLNSVNRYKPTVFMMENLPKLLDFIGVKDWGDMFPDYKIRIITHPMSFFGNSQATRKRLLVLGVLKDNSTFSISQFKRVTRVNEPMLVKDILKITRSSKDNYKDFHDRVLAMYDYRDKTKKTLTYQQVNILWATDFREEYKWPIKSSKMKTLPGVYRNRLKAYPLTVRPSNRQFMPDGSEIGIQDFRIIMGLPDNFKIMDLKKYPEIKEYNHNLNYLRTYITKGACYEVGVWFKNCLNPSHAHVCEV